MKKIFLALVFTVFSAFIVISAYASQSGPAQERPIIQRTPVKEGVDRQSTCAAGDYFDSCLSEDEHGFTVYPDTYGGCYISDDGTFVIQVTTPDHSEYQFLQDEFPCIVFEQVEYSYNYLFKLAEDYMLGYDPETETVYGGGVDVYKNRAVIDMDEETLSHKTNDPESPIVFQLGTPIHCGPVKIENKQAVVDDFPLDIVSATEEQQDNTDKLIEKSSATINVKGGEILVNQGWVPIMPECGLSAGIGCITSSNKKGLVICGHNIDINDKIYLNGSYIGKVTFTSFADKLGDYGIVTLADNVTADGATYCGPSVIRYNLGTHDAKVGDKLFKYSKKNGFAELTVIATDRMQPYEIDGKTVNVYGMTLAEITSGTVETGDSGVGIYYNSTEDGYTNFLEFSGILSGSGEGIVAFTPLKYITRECTIVT